jgi:C2 domain
VKENTATPVWNEIWRVKNVPLTADLVIKVMDKDQGSMTDDFIGTVKASISAGAKEADIEGALFRRSRGTFWLKVRRIFLPTTSPLFIDSFLDCLHACSR